MFRKSQLATAFAAAALGIAALASPASAQPIDNVTLDTANHKFSFGNGCAVGAAPATPGTLNWRNNANNTSGAPLISGTLCLQGTTADARMHVVYHELGGGQITQFSSNPATGNGSPLNQFAVSAGGPRISYQTLDHVHVEIERDNGNGNGFEVVDTVALYP